MEVRQEEGGPGGTISTAAVKLLHEYTGRGPTKARLLINQDMVTIVLADTAIH